MLGKMFTISNLCLWLLKRFQMPYLRSQSLLCTPESLCRRFPSTANPPGDITTSKPLYSPRKTLVILYHKPRFHLCTWLYPDSKTFHAQLNELCRQTQKCTHTYTHTHSCKHTNTRAHKSHTHSVEGSISAGHGPSHPFWFKVCLFSSPESPINDPRLSEGAPPLSSLHFHFPHSSVSGSPEAGAAAGLAMHTHTQRHTHVCTQTHIAYIYWSKLRIE